MKEKNKILFIKENYQKHNASSIAKKLDITTYDVYKIVRQQGLKKYKKDTAPRKLKPDIQVNPTQEIHAPRNHDGELIPLRIDQRTVILIPASTNPNERKKKYLENIKKSRLNHND
jgi:hypothetical protein